MIASVADIPSTEKSSSASRFSSGSTRARIISVLAIGASLFTYVYKLYHKWGTSPDCGAGRAAVRSRGKRGALVTEADRGTDESEALFAMLEELGVINARELGLEHVGVVALCDAHRHLDEGKPGAGDAHA